MDYDFTWQKYIECCKESADLWHKLKRGELMPSEQEELWYCERMQKKYVELLSDYKEPRNEVTG